MAHHAYPASAPAEQPKRYGDTSLGQNRDRKCPRGLPYCRPIASSAASATSNANPRCRRHRAVKGASKAGADVEMRVLTPTCSGDSRRVRCPVAVRWGAFPAAGTGCRSLPNPVARRFPPELESLCNRQAGTRQRLHPSPSPRTGSCPAVLIVVATHALLCLCAGVVVVRIQVPGRHPDRSVECVPQGP